MTWANWNKLHPGRVKFEGTELEVRGLRSHGENGGDPRDLGALLLFLPLGYTQSLGQKQPISSPTLRPPCVIKGTAALCSHCQPSLENKGLTSSVSFIWREILPEAHISLQIDLIWNFKLPDAALLDCHLLFQCATTLSLFLLCLLNQVHQ